jgi:hypothetical protein
MRRLAAALAIALLVFSGSAQGGNVDADLASAQQAYVDLEFDKANQIADSIARARGLTHDQLVRTTRLLARTHAILGHEKEARDAFVRLLTYAPDERDDKNLPPRVTAPLIEARGILASYAERPGMEVTASAVAGAYATMRVTTRDPTHVVRRVVAAWRWGGTGEFSHSSVAVGTEIAVPLPTPSVRATRLDYWAHAVDDQDDVVFEVGSAVSPKTVLATEPGTSTPRNEGRNEAGEGRSVFASPLFWVATGVVLAAAAGTGAYFATRKATTESEAPTSANLAPALWCNTGPCK